tara:strand:+ start:8757 stop:9878 length:1122 start_codon:yes stop_codon:yes gene_type:complete
MTEVPVIMKNAPKYEGRLECTFTGCDVSLVNGIRRTILSDIPVYGFNVFPYAENDVHIEVNTSRQNNEVLKHRMSCIPVHLTDFTLPFREALFEINVTNNTKDIQYVTTNDITVRQVPPEDADEMGPMNKELLKKMDPKLLFPVDPITKDPIIICRLRPSITKDLSGDSLKLFAKISIHVAKENACYNVISTCSFGNTMNLSAANIAWEQNVVERKYETPEEEEKERQNWLLLEGKRYFKERSFDFIVESIGIYENEVLLQLACKIMVEKLLLMRDLSNITIKESNTTIPNCKDMLLSVDYSVGKILEHFIYQKYYEESKQLQYVSFFKEHPHNLDSILRIAFKPGTDVTLEVIFPTVCDMIIDYLKKVSNLF